MSKKYLLLLLMGMVGLILQSPAQGFLKTQGKAIVNENGDTVLLRGMGLGGWMVQEGYMLQTAAFANPQHKIKEKIEDLIGKADMDAFYDAWLANGVRKIDVDSLKSWGFNSIRLPMHYNLFTLPIEDEPVQGQHTWLTKGFVLTDSVISWCKQNQMYVVLDLHAAPGGQGYDQGISDYDPTKPSLWESKANRDKMVALWKKLAERYVDEPWVAGYDLLNEPNWNLPGGTLLRALYGEVMDSIRTVDNKHMIFIEGNWFANDFTGLTPPWDTNMVYSPHKYWSLNDQGSIQWVLDIRNNFNTPLYLGESGENSNMWFRDAINLLERNGIGWAWWPMKKVESIAGPLSVTKKPGYQSLLNYWNNGGSKPSASFAKDALMELAEDFKMENCVYQKDVIDAMFRQVSSNESVPYNLHRIPGVVYAADFNMGRRGVAYFDGNAATYQVSTGNFTAWNNGWTYRNDGVDIEACQDNINTNGYNVGWIENDEWMEYDIVVDSTAVYDVEFRMATAGFEGSFHLMADGGDISGRKFVANSGGYQSWQTISLTDVVLTKENKKLKFYSDGRDYNFSSMKFNIKGPTTDLDAEFLSAYALDPNTIQLNLNKPLQGTLPSAPADFEIFVNGASKNITQMVLNSDNSRIITFSLDHNIRPDDVVKMTYSGTQITAFDGATLLTFSLKTVQNNVPIVHELPGKVEAEDYFYQIGTSQENTFDVGRGKNLGNLDRGDYMDYKLKVPYGGIYEVTFRSASENTDGEIKFQVLDSEGIGTLISTINLSQTGGWQTWTNNTATINMPQGEYEIRVEIGESPFNLNWFEFNLITSNEKELDGNGFNLYPNPGEGVFTLEGNIVGSQKADIRVFDGVGKNIFSQSHQLGNKLNTTLDLRSFPNGAYYLVIQLEDGTTINKKILMLR